MSIPVLHTTRLTLRPHTSEDFNASHELWSDWKTVEFISGTPSTPAESWSRLLRYSGLWQLLGFGYWVVERNTDRQFIGEVGFADFHRNIEPSMRGIPEAGWVLASTQYGQGYATEAVAAMLRWSDAQANMQNTACIIQPNHSASIRVAEKVGYSGPMEATIENETVLQFRRLGKSQ